MAVIEARGLGKEYGGKAAVEDVGPFDGVVTQFAAFGAPYFVAYLLAMVSVFAWGH